MITALVLLPYVASTNLLLSRATVIIRFIGADSGDTIEIIRFAETTLPKPILIKARLKLLPPQQQKRLITPVYFNLAQIYTKD